MRHTLVAVWDAEVRAGTGHQPALAVSGSSKIMKETEGLCSHSPLDSHLFGGTQKIKLHFLPLGVSVVFPIIAGRLCFYFYTVKKCEFGTGWEYLHWDHSQELE